MAWILLEDGTVILLHSKHLSILYPKKKFTKLFQKQIDDKGRDNIGVSWNMTEIRAIYQAPIKMRI